MGLERALLFGESEAILAATVRAWENVMSEEKRKEPKICGGCGSPYAGEACAACDGMGNSQSPVMEKSLHDGPALTDSGIGGGFGTEGGLSGMASNDE